MCGSGPHRWTNQPKERSGLKDFEECGATYNISMSLSLQLYDPGPSISMCFISISKTGLLLVVA